MSQAHEEAHGHGGEHVPHVLPLSTYLATWGTLVVLTAVTVGASYVDLGALNLFLALAIATTKALVVSLIFMHLWFDHKFHSLIFGSALVFLAIFIGFTMFDTNARGQAEEVEAMRPAKVAEPFKDGTKGELSVKERYGLVGQAAGGEANMANKPGDAPAATTAAPTASAAPAVATSSASAAAPASASASAAPAMASGSASASASAAPAAASASASH
jgi:cytochrome c oxidase subunit 4